MELSKEQLAKHGKEIQAWAQGKKIKFKTHSGEWMSSQYPSWDMCYEYAIDTTPEPSYRPWKPEEAIGRVVRMPEWELGTSSIIIETSEKTISGPVAYIPKAGSIVCVSLVELKEYYTQLDGTPCGIKE